MMNELRHGSALLLLCVVTTLAGRAYSQEVALNDEALKSLGRDIVAACPASTDAISAAARDACAERLARIEALSTASINNSIRWGGASQGDFNPAHNPLTLLNTLVWRKLYLSLFTFSGESTLEVLPDESRLLRLTARLRPLPNSEYPYPFWHSAAKWRSYQQTAQVGLLFKGGKLLAAYRNAAVDPRAATRDATWSGFWTTDDAGKLQPRTALYSYLLSADNPYLHDLDRAYKEFANEAREHQCGACHNPANPVNMNPLVILNLPSQALSGRHQIVYQLSRNEMPPKEGISDDKSRATMLRLARGFERIGDQALSFEEKRNQAAIAVH
jgi:hypothetical protein